MPEDQPQTREPKICLNCGTENEWHHGQCISCGRTNFLTPQQYAANRRSSQRDILYSVLLVGFGLYMMFSFKDKLFTDRGTFLMVAMLFLVAIGSVASSIYKYKYAKNIPGWRIIALIVVIIYVVGILLRIF